jgi:hypothetical protein
VPELERDNSLDLAYGVTIRSSGVGATVGDVRRAPAATAPVRGVEPGHLSASLAETDDAAAVSAGLGTAVEAAGMRQVLSVPLDDLTVAPTSPTTPYVEMSVPAADPDEGQVVMEVDQNTGLVRWHIDVDAAATAVGVATGTPLPERDAEVGPVRAGRQQTFRIPVEQAPVGEAAQQRGFLGIGIKTVLHLIRFPIEAAASAAGSAAIGWWEDKNRPHALDLVTPDTISQPLSTTGVSADRLAQLADKPFLLMVHGTFSTVRGGFDGLYSSPDGFQFAELYQRYEGRVLGFDHPTLHVSPEFNADWFLKRLPTDRPLTLDLLTHSRGGLVGRRIGESSLAGAAARPAPQIRTLVHVGTPNGGTILASPDRWTTLLDVFSNLFTLLPDEPVSATIQAVIELVKQLATGVFTGLSGLTAMDPKNPEVVALNQPGAAGLAIGGTVRAVASDFTPFQGPMKLDALNLLVDRFFGAGNDLVVPTLGVSDAGAYRVSDPYVAPEKSAVTHTTYFKDAGVRGKLGEWLVGV